MLGPIASRDELETATRGMRWAHFGRFHGLPLVDAEVSLINEVAGEPMAGLTITTHYRFIKRDALRQLKALAKTLSGAP